jgi:TrmH family RNA methyltransferase
MISGDGRSVKKLVKELHDKKGRTEHGMFLVEGEVSVLEFLQSNYQLHSLIASGEFLADHGDAVSKVADNTFQVKKDEVEKLGTLSSNDKAIGIFYQKDVPSFEMENEIVLALSDVNDPGNLGTIIRIADWYGISKIVASKNTVDVYNPKVISATKGSFARVQVYYEDLGNFLEAHEGVPVLGADLSGENVHTFSFPDKGILLMGSESHGIHPDLKTYLTQTVTIPRHGHAESLNVGIATAVILDNWKR